jgi:hypothetical protein
MVQEANRGGDVDASAAYSSAAMAVRRGVRPTPIEVKINDESQRYLAFVHVVTHGRSGDRPIRLRTMVAYQGEKRPEKVLYVSTLVDAGPLGLPTATLDRRPDVQQVAWAAWKDLANGELWVATSGQAGIVEKELLGPCPNLPSDAVVQCTLGKFEVLLDGVFHRRRDGSREVDQNQRKTIATREGSVNGVVLVFANPSR